MLHGSILLASVALLLSGCAAGARHPDSKALVRAEPVEPAGWEAAITASDRARLVSLPDVWAKTRASVPARAKAQLETTRATLPGFVAAHQEALYRLAVLTGNWELSTAAVSGMGVLTLALGWVVALTRKTRLHDEDSADG